MSGGIPPESRDLLVRLRASTASRHAAIEALPFFAALRRETLPRQSVVSYLRGLSIVHAVLESCLSQAGELSGDFWGPGMARSPDLRATLAAADAARLPDVPQGIDAAVRLGDRILLASHRPLNLLGPLYVLEGSQLGGQILRRHLAAALGILPEQVAYCSEPRTVARRWASLVGALAALELTEPALSEMVAAAQATFDGISELAQASFPYAESELRHRITAINPEAGRHGMPQSEVEIARALRCADLAWRRFPYLEARYGERGRRFTSSDSCWLVTLHGLDEATLLRTLSWLREVLTSRGLPTIILERHLEAIDDDFRARPPEGAAAAAGFRFVIETFRAARADLIPIAIQSELIDRWERRLAACDGMPLAGAAELIVAARLDAACGIPRAWEATSSWFVDSSRFSEDWIASIAGLEREVNEILRVPALPPGDEIRT